MYQYGNPYYSKESSAPAPSIAHASSSVHHQKEEDPHYTKRHRLMMMMPKPLANPEVDHLRVKIHKLLKNYSANLAMQEQSYLYNGIERSANTKNRILRIKRDGIGTDASDGRGNFFDIKDK